MMRRMPGNEGTDLHDRLAELLDGANTDHAQLEALASRARAEMPDKACRTIGPLTLCPDWNDCRKPCRPIGACTGR